MRAVSVCVQPGRKSVEVVTGRQQNRALLLWIGWRFRDALHQIRFLRVCTVTVTRLCADGPQCRQPAVPMARYLLTPNPRPKPNLTGGSLERT